MARQSMFARILATLVVASVAPAVWGQTEAPKPNIVVIIADDLGRADVSFNGGQIKTPAIDSIATSGAKLDQFYVQPVCSPTRAAFLTGRYPMRLGLQVGVVRPWADYGLPLEEQTLAQGLKSAGYATAIVGKWHLGHSSQEYLPTRRGFDHQYGHYNGALDYNTHIRDGGFDWHKDDKVNRDEGYSTHLLARESVRLINERDKAKPLFLYVPFNAVHSPHQVPAKYSEAFGQFKEPRKTYAGMVVAMDEAIGQILEAIDKNGIRKDTLIIFSSDNGGPAPGRVTDNGPLRAGKGTLYEGGVRVAAAASWEGHIKPGSTVKEPIHISDLYPTLLKLAGAKVDQKLPLDGVDVWPTITKGTPSTRKEIVLNSTPRGGAIRVGNWKLVLGGNVVEGDDGAPPPAAPQPSSADAKPSDAQPAADAQPARPRRNAARKAAGSAGVELFDLSTDPDEKNNLAEQQPQKVQELRARYDAIAAQAVKPQGGPKPADFKTPKVWGEKD